MLRGRGAERAGARTDGAKIASPFGLASNIDTENFVWLVMLIQSREAERAGARADHPKVTSEFGLTSNVTSDVIESITSHVIELLVM